MNGERDTRTALSEAPRRYLQAVWHALPAPARQQVGGLVGRSKRLSALTSNVRRIRLDDLDDELAVAARLFERSEDEGRAHLLSLELVPPDDAPADPFSPEYREWTWRLYERISGRSGYTVENESSPFDLERAIRRPFPYQTGSAVVVGQDLQSRGVVLQALSNQVGAQPPARVVEFGPGWGNLTTDLRATGYEVIGVEVDPRFCTLLDHRLGQPVPGTPRGSVARDDMLSFEVTEPADVAVFFESFHHCSDHLAMLERLHQIVKADGHVVFAAEPVQTLPFPWGPRLDGLSLWSMRTYGWLELGFSWQYFRTALGRTGWKLEGRRLITLPSGAPLLIARSDSSVVALGRRARVQRHSTGMEARAACSTAHRWPTQSPDTAQERPEPGSGGWPTDLTPLLHRLREQALEQEPGGAEVVVSGGAPDAYYAEWFAAHYATPPKRHISVEKFREPPEQLPSGVEFVQGSLGDLAGIDDESVDLVFAGQVTEHLWAEDLAGFLVAAHRIIRPGGHLTVDSPNRSITLATGWRMPEHTLELTPAEFRELVVLAGFEVEQVVGIWLCSDPVTGTVLPHLPAESPPAWPVKARVEAGTADPDHSIIWWMRARRLDRSCDAGAVHRRVRELYTTYRKELFGRLLQPHGVPPVTIGGLPAVTAGTGVNDYLVIGPAVAMPPGPGTAVFTFVPTMSTGSSGAGYADPDDVAAYVDLAIGDDHEIVAERPVTVGELPNRGERVQIPLNFSLDDTCFSCETRVRTLGTVPVGVLLGVLVAGAEGPTTARRRPLWPPWD